MRILFFLFCAKIVFGNVWKNGIIHYAINSKDYDFHSQEIIMTTLSRIMDELCVKFFQSPMKYNSSDTDKILYISNPEKRKTCETNRYNFNKPVVEMAIGYKCLNPHDITAAVVEMLRASIDPKGLTVNSFDLIKKFNEKESSSSMLLSASDRNYINAHFKTECGSMSKPLLIQRRLGSLDVEMSKANVKYYKDKVWPLGIVLYGVDDELGNSLDYKILRHAMTSIEISTCVVFQEVKTDGVLEAKSQIWFSRDGNEMPMFGFVENKQTVKLSSFVNGAAGHDAHVYNNLFRVLGVHMMSNRFDRDNYVTITWRNVEKGKEQYLERSPEEAWLTQIPYDFDSITHAPANYMCGDCSLGAATVQPIQDYLWQRTISMGHSKELSKYDVQIINMLYITQCRKRLFDV
ncbi:uncharacterized protein LOC116778426 [Danaus plexippus]|uniref:uncharacterized protein LOC116778426 n=1 Tax=Danaus plexippus TaxID=13037 RepID=UPI002AB1D74A|nr:uncharacterized protein LOC116778426 [Danaus plexippus]